MRITRAAQFRLDELTPMKAKITRVRWSNPHVFYAGTVINDKGGAEEWVFEGHSISGAREAGLDCRSSSRWAMKSR